MDKHQTFKAGCVQFDVKTGDIQSNLKTTRDAVIRLAEKGAIFAVLPELWSSGFDPYRMKGFAEKTPDIIKELSRLAEQNRIMIAGSMPELHNGRLYNTMFLVDQQGAVAASYRKIHLFPLMGEDACLNAGAKPVVCNTPVGIIGMMICYDLRFPELCRSLALKGAQIILASAQWPDLRIEHWDVLLRARAIENQVFVIACNRIGKEGDLSFSGHSQIISPSGKTLAKLENAPGEISADVDLTEIADLKRQFDTIVGRVSSAYEY
jgi:predicted amidohydrolase